MRHSDSLQLHVPVAPLPITTHFGFPFKPPLNLAVFPVSNLTFPAVTEPLNVVVDVPLLISSVSVSNEPFTVAVPQKRTRTEV